MSDHIRPAHPGCTACRSRHVELMNIAGDMGDVKKKLVRAQEDRPGQVAVYVEQLEDLKARHVTALEVYQQHYTSTHPAFSDSDAPFAKSPSHRLTDDDVAELRALLRDGDHTYAEIAEVFGVNASTVQYHAARAGLTFTDLRTAASASTPDAATDAEGQESPASPSASPLPLLGIGQPADWMKRRICDQTDPEIFFPEKGGSTREAKAICLSCPVQAECLDYAIDNDERFGIWGGLSERERRKIKRAMQDEAGQVRVQCPRCTEDFENDTALTTHVRVHDRADVPCPHCDHVGKGPAGLAVHIHHSHPDLRNAS